VHIVTDNLRSYSAELLVQNSMFSPYPVILILYFVFIV